MGLIQNLEVPLLYGHYIPLCTQDVPHLVPQTALSNELSDRGAWINDEHYSAKLPMYKK